MSEVRVLRRIADELTRASGAGLGSDEAAALWAALAGKKPAEIWLTRDSEPPADMVQRFWNAVAQRQQGVPFAYVVGRIGFRTLELAIDRRALIPRPETEGLVELVLKHGKREAGSRVAPPISGRVPGASRFPWPSRAISRRSWPRSNRPERPRWRGRT